MSGQIANERHRFSSIGRCIYCGDDASPLFNEHIIPYALNGDGTIFEKATCKICADKFTREFEAETLKNSFETFRFQIGAPSRSVRKRRSKPKTSHPVQMGSITPGFPGLISAVEHADRNTHPGGFIGLRLWFPKLLTGQASSKDDKVEIVSSWDIKKARVFSERSGKQDHFVGQIRPQKFARFLAKIAHSYAIAELGPNSFEPLALPLINGDTEIFTDVVGGEYDLPTPSDNLHVLQCWAYDHGPWKTQCVKIQLFCFAGLPIYHVAVGTFR